MLRLQWTHRDIETMPDVEDFIQQLDRDHPQVGAMDTETTGLHIIKDRPFVIILGWRKPRTDQGYTFTVDLERHPDMAKRTLDVWLKKSKDFKHLLGHNLKYDLHMMYNIGYDFTEHPNLSDTQHYIRFAHDALQPSEGGPPLGLKDYSTRYIDANAKHLDHEIQRERMFIAKRYNEQLRRKLKLPAAKMAKYFDDTIFEVSDLPLDLKTSYLEWLHDLPLVLQHSTTGWLQTDQIPYNMVDRKILLKYAHFDVVLTLEVYYQTEPIVEHRQQTVGLEIENALIAPFFRMERVGFKIDKTYLEESRKELKRYIQERRNRLKELTNKEITIGQHQVIKEILEEKYQIKCKSSSSAELDLIKDKPENARAKEFIELIQELRTLEKWYSVYITRFQKDLQNTDRIYTSVNQVGAVSGRITSNLQQFPKQPITKSNGSELFHPRRMVIVPEGQVMTLIDYSQIELRVQAFYTMLIQNPDRNMIRAYMPYECQAKNGKWYLNEEPEKEWSPTDIHAETTKLATGLNPGEPGFKEARSNIGKRVNFAKNYGAQLGKIKEMFPDKSHEECVMINDAYYKAFPGVKEYHKYCERCASQRASTTNLFGIRYYNTSGHKLKNLLVQGSAAYLLKTKIIEIDKALKGTNTKLQMQIHDELLFEGPKDLRLVTQIKSIMEKWDECPIPIIAEPAIAETSWNKKEELHEI